MNILVVRVSAIGDVIHTIPAILLLKKVCPNASIGWVVQEKAASIIKEQPFIDKLFILPDKFLSLSNLFKTKKVIEQLKQTAWDIIIDFQGLEKTAVIINSLSGRKYGFASGHARSVYSTLFTHKRIGPSYTNIIQKNLALASYVASDFFKSSSSPIPEKLGCSEVLHIQDKDKIVVDCWLKSNQIVHPILLIPNTTWDSKHWPLDYWLEISTQLSARYTKSVVLVGSFLGGMAQELAAMCEKKGIAVFRLPTFNLLSMAYLIKQSKLVIGPDTGLVHLADLMGAQSIAIFGPTNARKHGPFLYHHNRVHALQIPCSHYYEKQHGSDDCMRNFTAEQMLQHLDTLLVLPTQTTTRIDNLDNSLSIET